MPYLLPDDRLLAMLREDAPYGDLTTRGLGIGERRGTATFRTRATITACCVEEAERLMLARQFAPAFECLLYVKTRQPSWPGLPGPSTARRTLKTFSFPEPGTPKRPSPETSPDGLAGQRPERVW